MPLYILDRYTVAANIRREGLSDELHPRLLRGTSCLAIVTPQASANYILPDMSAPSMPRIYMVQAKLSGFTTAILAGIFIPLEHLSAG